MDGVLIYILIAILFSVMGVALGIYIQKLKVRSSQEVWQEREFQLNSTVETLNERLFSKEEEQKQLQLEKEQLKEDRENHTTALNQ